MNMVLYKQKSVALLFILIVILCSGTSSFSYPLEFPDSRGNGIVIMEKPSSVVSLVPSVTEIIYSIGAGDALKAITYNSTYPPETSEKEIVGGFFSPSLERIETMQPDLIFYSSLHKKVEENPDLDQAIPDIKFFPPLNTEESAPHSVLFLLVIPGGSF